MKTTNTTETEELQLYIKKYPNGSVKYGYGPPWVAMAMYMDDLEYDTPEEAKEAWEKIWSKT